MNGRPPFGGRLEKVARPQTFADYYHIANWLRWVMVCGLWARVVISYIEAKGEAGRLWLLAFTVAALVVHLIVTVLLNRSVPWNAASVSEKTLIKHCWADALIIAIAHISSLRTDSDQHLGLVIPLLAAALFSRFKLTVKVLGIILLIGIVFPVVAIYFLLEHYPDLAKPNPQYSDWAHILVCNLFPRMAFWCIAEVPIWWLIHRNHLLNEEASVFKVLAEHVDFAVFRKNTERRFVYANKTLARQLGVTVEFMLGKTDAEVGMAAANEYRESDDMILIDEDSMVDRVEANYAQDEEIPKIRTVKIRLDDETGRVIGLVGICDLRISRREVAYYRQFLERIRHAMFHKDSQGRFVWVNERFAEIVDRPVNQILGKTDVGIGYPEKLANWYRMGDLVVTQEGKLLDQEEEHYFNNLRETRWVRVQKSQMVDDQGKMGVFGMFWDVHASRMEVDRVRAWFATRGNNPLLFLRQEILNKQRARFESLANSFDPSKPGLSADQIAGRQAMREGIVKPTTEAIDLGIYTTDLLFAQFDALAIFRDGTAPENLVWKDFTRDAEKTLREQAYLFRYLSEKKVEFELTFDMEGTVLTDQRKLIAVFWILVSNAIRAEYMRRRGLNELDPEIQIQLTSTGPMLELRVTDQGMGFTQEEKEGIEGGRHFAFPESSQCGLRLLRRIAALSEGKIVLDSPGPGRGATFAFRWPSSVENPPS